MRLFKLQPHYVVSKPRGVALLMVMVTLALISSIVIQLTTTETVKYKMAVYERDSVKAEALAMSGLNFSRLILTIQDGLQAQMVKYVVPMLPPGVQLPSLVIWELIPIDSGSIKSLADGDFIETIGIEVDEEQASNDELDEAFQNDLEFETVFKRPKGGFGAFDGHFAATITDEESKISFRSWQTTNDYKARYARAQLLNALIQPFQYDKLFNQSFTNNNSVRREQLVANLYDWIDDNDFVTDPSALPQEWGRSAGGSERNLYSGKGNIRPKNAYFDSLAELRLVLGMSDEILNTIGDALTIYGNGKVNILTANDKVLASIVRYCGAESGNISLYEKKWMNLVLSRWNDLKDQGAAQNTPEGFADYISKQVSGIKKEECAGIMTMESQNFTISSEATVGDVTKTLTLVIRAVAGVEEPYYFRNN